MQNKFQKLKRAKYWITGFISNTDEDLEFDKDFFFNREAMVALEKVFGMGEDGTYQIK